MRIIVTQELGVTGQHLQFLQCLVVCQESVKDQNNTSKTDIALQCESGMGVWYWIRMDIRVG